MAEDETPPLPGARRPSGGRRVARPSAIVPCASCGRPTGYSYGLCPDCTDAVERSWRADWEALLSHEGIAPGGTDEVALARRVLAEEARYPWTIVDCAMRLVACEECGGERGGGPPDCPACETAFRNLFAYDFEALPAGKMSYNEHALRVTRWVLRYPARYSAHVVSSRREVMPLLLTGGLPSTREAQAMAARSKPKKGGASGSGVS
jgi:hypothetical protein